MNHPGSAPHNATRLSRRQLLRHTGVALITGSLLDFGARAFGAEPAAAAARKRKAAPVSSEPAGPLTPLNRFPRSVHDYYVERARAAEREADARRAALRTRADAERYVAEVREKIRQCFGPLPDKTPLNARITAVHQRDNYKIENVIFESRPGFLVTSNLYVPTGRSGPFPSVVATCGHSNSGKAAGTYQSFAQALTRQGYVVLIFDPMGQGERLQHVASSTLAARFGIGPPEHTYVGNRMMLVEENLPAWFVWDGIRALDYLLSRSEVDRKHIGVTGNSGGGTQTTWLCGVEPRITMAAPSCFITTLRRNVENELSQDAEQYPWRMLALGLDHSDFIAAMAPRPVRILGQERDYFDARGFEEAADRLRQLYRLLGAEENFDAFLGPDPHGYSLPNRQAMYGWFNRHTGATNGSIEPALKLESDETLRCTPQGQVATFRSTTVFTHGRDKSKLLASSRPRPEGEALRALLGAALRLPPREGVADYRILRPLPGRGYPTRGGVHYALETEPGISVVVTRLHEGGLQSRVPRGPTRALLYVAHRSADAELRNDTWLRELIAQERAGTAHFACDLRGIGESRPALSAPDVDPKGGSDYFHAGLGLMFDQPMPGQRTFDLLRVIDWLQAHGHREIHLVARGEGAIPSTFAGVLHDGITQVTLRNALRSYADVAETEAYRWPLSAFVPGVLSRFDLPDCYRELERKSLRHLDLADAAGVPP